MRQGFGEGSAAMAGLRDEAMPTVRNIAPVPALSGQFTHYLENHSLPVQHAEVRQGAEKDVVVTLVSHLPSDGIRSEEHTSELQSLMRNSYAVFCLKKKIKTVMKADTKKKAQA